VYEHDKFNEMLGCISLKFSTNDGLETFKTSRTKIILKIFAFILLNVPTVVIALKIW